MISFRIDWFDLLAVQGTLKFSPMVFFKNVKDTTSKKEVTCYQIILENSILNKVAFFLIFSFLHESKNPLSENRYSYVFRKRDMDLLSGYR